MDSMTIVLAFLAVGRLPWQGIDADTKEERYERILQRKLDLDKYLRPHLEKELKDEPSLAACLLSMIEYCRKLKFEEAPDYEKLKAMLMKVRGAKGGEFDWVDDSGGLTPAAKGKSKDRLSFGVTPTAAGGVTDRATRGKASNVGASGGVP